MYLNQGIGKIGENLACQYLEKNNYKILKRNFRCRQGEIDIISYDKTRKELVFIEVKTRTSLKYGRPGEAVEKVKQQHIKKVAQYYIYKNKLAKKHTRFDVIEVFLNNSNYKIEHIKQAFE